MSHRKIVTFPGRLEGMGRTVDCIVGAVRVSLPNSSDSALSPPFTIHQAPADLPEGKYILTYRDGLQAAQLEVQKSAVGWISARM